MEPDVNWRSRIVAIPGVVGGKPAVKGTRLSAEFLLGLLAQGWSEEAILEEYEELQQADLRALFAYAAEILRDETGFPLATSS